jgi:hypothetical protein
MATGVEAWDRVKRLVLELDHDFLEVHAVNYNEKQDIETFHATASWINLQKFVVDYLRINQHMSVAEIGDFCGVSRNTANNWISKTRKESVVMHGPTLWAAISKARKEFGQDFSTRLPTTERLHLLGLISLIQFARVEWFNDPPFPARIKLSEQIIKIFTYLVKHRIITLGNPPLVSSGTAFFVAIRAFKETAHLSDEQISDVFAEWLKPYTAIYLLASALFDDRVGFPERK